MTRLLSVADIAHMLRLSSSTVRRKVTLPEPTQTTPGGHRRWDEAVIEAWIKAGGAEQTTAAA